jgi:uncharacterized protein (DUF2141 family)
MKKLLLAAAVATLSVNAVQAAPTLYGKLNVSINQVDNKISMVKVTLPKLTQTLLVLG